MMRMRILGLLAAAAAALMAFAGTASATEITTSSNGSTWDKATVGTVFHATNEGAVTLDGAIPITCNHSTVEGEVTNAGGSSVTVSGHIDTLTFSECSQTIWVLADGTLEVHTTETKNNNNGKLTSSGARITVITHGGLGTTHCTYETKSTLIGHITGSSTTTATLDIDSAAIPIIPTDFGCGVNTAEWTGKYQVTSPMFLTIH